MTVIIVLQTGKKLKKKNVSHFGYRKSKRLAKGKVVFAVKVEEEWDWWEVGEVRSISIHEFNLAI